MRLKIRFGVRVRSERLRRLDVVRNQIHALKQRQDAYLVARQIVHEDERGRQAITQVESLTRQLWHVAYQLAKLRRARRALEHSLAKRPAP